MGYFVYLIYTVVASSISGINRNFPLITVILLGAAYGLQVIIFLFKRQWQHIGWLVIYLLAMPLFVFWLPLYSFWHMDDFSWGNTRVVVGERGGKKLIVDEEPFDPESIPMKKWSEVRGNSGVFAWLFLLKDTYANHPLISTSKRCGRRSRRPLVYHDRRK